MEILDENPGKKTYIDRKEIDKTHRNVEKNFQKK